MSEIFDSFFVNQCSLIPNNSILPSELKLLTERTLTSCDFSETDILQIINNQDSNKAHGHMISMLILCGEAICRPLNIIFKTCLNTGKFPSEWKKGNVPIHKKDDKQIVKNYRPVSLLPICGKMFERLIYNVMYDFLTENDLLSPNQSGFRSGDSCSNQLLSINHEILNAFDKGLEVRGIFLDISEAFDKVWHDRLIFKLRQNGISGDIINILQEFLRNRKQRAVLNGQCSFWVDVNAGVPQGSILGPLLFLIYINDLSDGLKCECKLFADDTSLFFVVNDINTSASDLNEDLEKIGNWPFKWKMNFNPGPNKQAQEIIFSRKKTASLHPLKSTQIHKHLGMMLDSNLSYEHRIKSILNKVNKTIGLSRKFQLILPRHSLITIYKTCFRPHLGYGT